MECRTLFATGLFTDKLSIVNSGAFNGFKEVRRQDV
jgi:hypothetical protein